MNTPTVTFANAVTQVGMPQANLFMNNGATAAAVAYDCSGVYVETDF